MEKIYLFSQLAWLYRMNLVRKHFVMMFDKNTVKQTAIFKRICKVKLKEHGKWGAAWIRRRND